MIVKQTTFFKRTVKKLTSKEKASLDKAIKAIVKNTELGQLKKGDLAGVRVHKYKHTNQQYLLAYQMMNDDEILMLLALGVHENFYRDLKKRLH